MQAHSSVRKRATAAAAESAPEPSSPSGAADGSEAASRPAVRESLSEQLGVPLWRLALASVMVLVVVCGTVWVALPPDLLRKVLPQAQAVFTPESLARYNGKGGRPFYLAVLGQVFDVTKGRKHYGEGGGYAFFVGRDATRAYVTGEFKKDLNDDVSGLSDDMLHGLVDWRSFYHKDYTYKGVVVGAFYDAHGAARPALASVEAGAARHERDKQFKQAAAKKVPNCNSRWSQAAGGYVWCDNGMYPRKIFEQLPGSQRPHTRCACFPTYGWSDLRQLYPNCKPDAHECQTAPPPDQAKG